MANRYNAGNKARLRKLKIEAARRRTWLKDHAETTNVQDACEILHIHVKTLYQDEIAAGVRCLRHVDWDKHQPKRVNVANELANVWLRKEWK